METVRLTFMFSLGIALVLEKVLDTVEAWQTETAKRNKKIHQGKTIFLGVAFTTFASLLFSWILACK